MIGVVDLWSSYPGPILKDWSELEGFMLTMTTERADELQARVTGWYKDFKLLVKQRVKAQLLQALEGVSNRISISGAAAPPVVVDAPKVAEASEPVAEVATVESVIKHLYSQIETLHYRLSEVERELSGSLQREQSLLAALKEKNVIE